MGGNGAEGGTQAEKQTGEETMRGVRMDDRRKTARHGDIDM